MTKYVASIYAGYTYRLNNKGLVNRIYYHPPSGKKAKFPNKVLEIVPWFTAYHRAEEAIGVYTPHEVDMKLFSGELYLFKTKWVDADSLKITQKKMAIPKNRSPTIYSDDWKKYVPYRNDARAWMPHELELKQDYNPYRIENPVESYESLARRGKPLFPQKGDPFYKPSIRWK